MRLPSPSLLLLLASAGGAAAFSPSPTRRGPGVRRRPTPLRMALSDVPEDAPKKKKVLTAADVMAKSKGPGGSDPKAPGEQDKPKLFSPAIYDDFQSALLTLEKRITDGPGSLKQEEVERFEEETGRIVAEMREFLSDPEGAAERIRKSYEKKEVVEVTAKEEEEKAVVVEEPKSVPPPPAAAVRSPPLVTTPIAQAAPAAPPTPVATVAATVGATVAAAASSVPPENVPPSEDEPTDAASSYGLARGTKNTYLIDGMEGMSPEEYRAKLQETISARQANRRKSSLASNRGIIGNASSQGYLDSLSGVTNDKQGQPGNKQGETRASFETNVGGGSSGSNGSSNSSSSTSNSSGERNTSFRNIKNKPRDKKSRLGAMRNAFGLVADSKVEDDQPERGSIEKTKAFNDNEGVASTTSIDNNEVEMPVRAEAEEGQSDAGEAEGSPEEEGSDTAEATAVISDSKPKSEEASPQQQGADGSEETVVIEATAVNPGSDSVVKEPPQPQEVDESESAEAAEKLMASPILTMKMNKLQEEKSRKSEWLLDDEESEANEDEEGNEDSMEENAGDHENAGKHIDDSLPADQTAFDAALDRKTSPVSPASPLSAVAEDDWWGSKGPTQRPKPAASFGMQLAPDRGFEASRKVSSESTRAFAHSNVEDRSARTSPKEEGTLPKKFDVHGAGSLRRSSAFRPAEKRRVDHRGPGDVRTAEPKKYVAPKSLVDTEIRLRPAAASVIEEAPKSLVETEVSHRPVASTKLPEYMVASDHRAVGDVRVDPNFAVSRDSSSTKSLIEAEERIRPAASSQLPEYAVATDHRGVGDRRKFSPRDNVVARSLVETEGRARPAPSSSHLPEYAQVKNHRSVGDVRDPQKTRALATKTSLIEEEARVRPGPSSNARSVNSQVRDHRGPGDDHALTRRERSVAATATKNASLIEGEERVRPASSSKSLPRGFGAVGDHRGPGDDHALTRRKKLTPADPSSQSLIRSEQSIRPVAKNSLHGFDAVPNHRGPGDDHALTRREKPLPTESSSQSLIANEFRIRPVSSSKNLPHGFGTVGDHRGPGDDHALTRREKPTTSEPSSESLIRSEHNIRPVAKNSPDGLGAVPNHRGPGDGHALTRREKPLPTESSSQSLIGSELRIRPVSSSKNLPHGFGVASDHRGPGDNHALTRREKPSLTESSKSLVETEHRIRPVSSSKNLPHGFGKLGDMRGPGDDRALTRREQPTEPSSQSLIKSEQRTRPIVSSSSNSLHGYGKTSVDHRDPGDSNALTRREKPSSSSPSSLIDSEQRMRPTPTSGCESLSVGDHRDVGDTRTITSKVQASAATVASAAADTPSLSEDEQRQRPVPDAGDSSQVSDHRWPGDERTITRKIKSSFPSAAVVASLAGDEPRLRPVPPATQLKSATMVKDRTGPSAMASDGPDETPPRDENARWWNEDTQRRPINSSPLGKMKAKVLTRSMDDSLKEKESRAADDSSSASPEESSQSSSFALNSLLKDKKERWLTSARAKMSPTINKSPIAEIRPSSLQSLVKRDDEDTRKNSAGRKASKMSQLLKDERSKPRASRSDEKRGFYHENPQRPRGYTKHKQPLRTTNVEKNEAPPDYGNVIND